MKRNIIAALFMVGLTFGISNRALAQESAVKVDVPFDFAVGTHVLPAGTYKIAAHGELLAFDNLDAHASLYTLANRGDMAANGLGKLTFDHVHGQYFLRRIESTSAMTSVEFPVSKLERKSSEIAETRSIYAETSSR
jgi:hypothetical protein